jgi:hypothetical protein
LEGQCELRSGKGAPEIRFKLEASDRRVAHVRLEKLDPSPTVRIGPVQGQGGVTQERIGCR